MVFVFVVGMGKGEEPGWNSQWLLLFSPLNQQYRGGELFLDFPWPSLWEHAGVSGEKACKCRNPLWWQSSGTSHTHTVQICPTATCQNFWFNVPFGLYDIRQLLPHLSKLVSVLCLLIDTCFSSDSGWPAVLWIQFFFFFLRVLEKSVCCLTSCFLGRAEAFLFFFSLSLLYVWTQTRCLLCHFKT